MPQFEYTPTNPTMYDRPRCPTCAMQMYLSHIEPGQPGFDLRTFTCPSCGQPEEAASLFLSER